MVRQETSVWRKSTEPPKHSHVVSPSQEHQTWGPLAAPPGMEGLGCKSSNTPSLHTGESSARCISAQAAKQDVATCWSSPHWSPTRAAWSTAVKSCRIHCSFPDVPRPITPLPSFVQFRTRFLKHASGFLKLMLLFSPSSLVGRAFLVPFLCGDHEQTQIPPLVFFLHKAYPHSVVEALTDSAKKYLTSPIIPIISLCVTWKGF